MKVLVFEWLSGGGLWIDGEAPSTSCSFQRQGRAMVDCLSDDLTQAGLQVYSLNDVRFQCERDCTQTLVHGPNTVMPLLKSVAAVVDLIVLIVPESKDGLLDCCRAVKPWAAKLISPDERFVRLTSNKNTTAKWLADRGVDVAQGVEPHRGPPNVRAPVIVKPATGAGGENVALVNDWANQDFHDGSIEWRIEEYIEGRPASVSVLCGRESDVFLQPTWQVSDEEFGNYLFALPIKNRKVAARLLDVAKKTIRALPRTLGYVGIDMMVGQRVCVIDVNPRLTASYCQLRNLEPFNIAATMVDIATS